MRTVTDRRKFVLVAEDEPDVVRLLAYHFQRQGYRVGHAPDGLAAINDTFESCPDLIILDLLLPKLHGLEVCRLLKSSPLSRHIPIIMVTALATTSDKLKGFGLGADDYLTKPFQVAELVARVKTRLG